MRPINITAMLIVLGSLTPLIALYLASTGLGRVYALSAILLASILGLVGFLRGNPLPMPISSLALTYLAFIASVGYLEASLKAPLIRLSLSMWELLGALTILQALSIMLAQLYAFIHRFARELRARGYLADEVEREVSGFIRGYLDVALSLSAASAAVSLLIALEPRAPIDPLMAVLIASLVFILLARYVSMAAGGAGGG